MMRQMLLALIVAFAPQAGHAAGVWMEGSVVKVVGTFWGDTVTVEQSAGNIVVHLNNHSYTFPGTSVWVSTGFGADSVVFDASVTVPTTVFLGPGPDKFVGGSGPDSVYGDGGPDTLQGAKGADRLDGGTNWFWWNVDTIYASSRDTVVPETSPWPDTILVDPLDPDDPPPPTGTEVFPVNLVPVINYVTGTGGQRIGAQFTISAGVASPAKIMAVTFQLESGSFASATGYSLYRSDPNDPEVDIIVPASVSTVGNVMTLTTTAPYQVPAQTATHWQLRYNLEGASPIYARPRSIIVDVGGENLPALTRVEEWAWNVVPPTMLEALGRQALKLLQN